MIFDVIPNYSPLFEVSPLPKPPEATRYRANFENVTRYDVHFGLQPPNTHEANSRNLEAGVLQ